MKRVFNHIRRRLGVKLFLSYLTVIVAGAVVLGLATMLSLPQAFNRHLANMGETLQASTTPTAPGQGMGMGGGQGMGYGRGQGGVVMQSLYQNFRASFFEALTLALVAAGLVAILVSLLFSRSVVAPVRQMQAASRRIAAGRYEERVQVSRDDELGQLACDFNQMAGELEQVESMRRQLIGDVAHELRTPLTAIKGSAEGLMDGVLPAVPETYQQIHQEAARLARLVDDLQELSRVESKAFELDRRPVDLLVSVETVVHRLQGQFSAKQITLNSDLPAGLPPLYADEGRLVQVLTNLIGNALQYTPEGGRVTVGAVVADGKMQVSVQDTGLGISVEHLAHVFDRFYRVDKSRSRLMGGSGVGLTIARHLVEAHGGRIWAESAGAGQGSSFVFTIPVVD